MYSSCGLKLPRMVVVRWEEGREEGERAPQ